jgi:hypothetical protein
VHAKFLKDLPQPGLNGRASDTEPVPDLFVREVTRQQASRDTGLSEGEHAAPRTWVSPVQAP